MSGDVAPDADLVARLHLLEDWFVSADVSEKEDIAALHRALIAARDPDLDWLEVNGIQIISHSSRFDIDVVVDPAVRSQIAASLAAQMEPVTRTMRQLEKAFAIPLEQAEKVAETMRPLQKVAAQVEAQTASFAEFAKVAAAELSRRERATWRRKPSPTFNGPIRRPTARRQPRGRPTRTAGRRARAPARPSRSDPEPAVAGSQRGRVWA